LGANLDLIRATYEGSSSEENGRNLLAALAPDAEWTEAEGFLYAGTYVGPEAILAGVFRRLASEWVGYRADVHTTLSEVQRYTDDADRERLADQAMAKRRRGQSENADVTNIAAPLRKHAIKA
jgi:ketosteroid isomerase-like protein